MSDQFDPSAVPAPAAAAPVPEAHAPVPEATTPVPGSLGTDAPAGSSTPVGQVTIPEQSPQPSPEEIEQWRSAVAERDELRAEQARQKAEAEQQAQQSQIAQQRQQIAQWAEEQMANAYNWASRLDTDQERQAHILQAQRAITQKVDEAHQYLSNQVVQQVKQREYAMQLAGYPDYLGKSMGLTPEQVEALRDLRDEHSMTATARIAAQFNAQNSTLKQTVNQTYAQQQANAMRASGVTAMGGTNVSTAPATRISPEMSEAERDARFLRAIGMSS